MFRFFPTFSVMCRFRVNFFHIPEIPDIIPISCDFPILLISLPDDPIFSIILGSRISRNFSYVDKYFQTYRYFLDFSFFGLPRVFFFKISNVHYSFRVSCNLPMLLTNFKFLCSLRFFPNFLEIPVFPGILHFVPIFRISPIFLGLLDCQVFQKFLSKFQVFHPVFLWLCHRRLCLD